MPSPPAAGGTAAETSRRGGGEDEGAGASDGGAAVFGGRKGPEFRSLVYRRGLAAEPPEEKARYAYVT